MWAYEVSGKYIKQNGKLYKINNSVTKKTDNAYKIKKEMVTAENYPPNDYYTWNGDIITGYTTESRYRTIKTIITPARAKEISGLTQRNDVEKIIITGNVEAIRSYTFYSYPNLKYLYFSEKGKKLRLYNSIFSPDNKIEKIEIPSRVVYLDNNIFGGSYYSQPIRELVINISNECEYLGYLGLPNLERVTINGNIPDKCRLFQYMNTSKEITLDVIVNGDWLNIPESAFSSAIIGSIKITGNIKTIGAYAFAGQKFKSFVIPKSVENICEKAFVSCVNATIYIPSGTGVTIGEDAFLNVKEVIYY